jgi:hypothetical protein
MINNRFNVVYHLLYTVFLFERYVFFLVYLYIYKTKTMSKEMGKYIDTFKNFILKENSTPEYDEILDLYNNLGLDGMSKDEIDFLKSGGQTKLPNRFKTRDLLDKHKETTKSHEDWQKSIAGVSSSKPIIPSKNKESNLIINRLKKILNEYPDWEIDYPYEGIGWGLGTFFQILFKDEKLFDELVEAIYGSKENYENDKSEFIKLVHIRSEKDWSRKYNSHRSSDKILGQEYKIAITIPKNWYEHLFDNHL